jgi:hypothetical protein
MSATDDILAAIAVNLAQPKRARTDAGEVEQHDLAQQVAAAKFAIQMTAVTNRSPFAALRFAQTVSPNASGAPDPATTSVYPPPGLSGLPGYSPYGCQ